MTLAPQVKVFHFKFFIDIISTLLTKNLHNYALMSASISPWYRLDTTTIISHVGNLGNFYSINSAKPYLFIGH